MKSKVKAIIYPVKDGVVPCEGRVVMAPTCLERAIDILWGWARFTAFASFWFWLGMMYGKIG